LLTLSHLPLRTHTHTHARARTRTHTHAHVRARARSSLTFSSLTPHAVTLRRSIVCEQDHFVRSMKLDLGPPKPLRLSRSLSASAAAHTVSDHSRSVSAVAPAPSVASAPRVVDARWLCEDCTLMNDGGVVCAACGGARDEGIARRRPLTLAQKRGLVGGVSASAPAVSVSLDTAFGIPSDPPVAHTTTSTTTTTTTTVTASPATPRIPICRAIARPRRRVARAVCSSTVPTRGRVCPRCRCLRRRLSCPRASGRRQSERQFSGARATTRAPSAWTVSNWRAR
jgi:hypothetical protein